MKNIGIKVKEPKNKCEDVNCPFHGSLSVRGQQFVGNVTSDRMAKTISVSWERRVKIPKYERYTKRKSKVKALKQDRVDPSGESTCGRGEEG